MNDQDTTKQLRPGTPRPTSHRAAPRRLLRSRDDRMLAGVAGGLGRYFDVDPVIVRIAFAISIFFGGLGVIAYAALALFVPSGDGGRQRDRAAADRALPRARDRRRDRRSWSSRSAGACSTAGSSGATAGSSGPPFLLIALAAGPSSWSLRDRARGRSAARRGRPAAPSPDRARDRARLRRPRRALDARARKRLGRGDRPRASRGRLR